MKINRIEELRIFIDKTVSNVKNDELRRHGYVHLYGVSQFCAMIALKRNQDVELATMAGMLHDLYTYKMMDSKGHAKKGSLLAKEILDSLKLTTSVETEIICSAILKHSDKKSRHSDFTEVLVDADVLQHYLYNVSLPIIEKDSERLASLMDEFGLTPIPFN